MPLVDIDTLQIWGSCLSWHFGRWFFFWNIDFVGVDPWCSGVHSPNTSGFEFGNSCMAKIPCHWYLCVTSESHVRWHWTQQMGEENWNEHSFPAMVPTSVYDLYTFFWLIGFGIICDYRKWTCNWFFQIRGEGHVYTCRLASRLIFKDAFKDIYTCIMQCWSGLSHDFLYLRIGNLYHALHVFFTTWNDDKKLAIFVSFVQDNQALLASSFSEWRREGKILRSLGRC